MLPTNKMRKALEKENRKYPEHLVRIEPIPEHMHRPSNLTEVWRSRAFLVQVFREQTGLLRLSVCRTSHNGERWEDRIGWDDLQRLKRECGRGEFDALEVYPRDRDLVDVANMRHLWVFDDGALVAFAWRAKVQFASTRGEVGDNAPRIQNRQTG